MRINTKIGDIFCVEVDNGSNMFMQFIASDITQLNSDVIRVFKKKYPKNIIPDLAEIVKDEILFYAHCVTKWGIKLRYWIKIGNISEVGDLTNILFRDTSDYGNVEVKVSSKWWVWKINEEQKFVGTLKGINKNAEIGIVMDSQSIVSRIKTGKYDGFYPEFE
jgi:Immunity protein 26